MTKKVFSRVVYHESTYSAEIAVVSDNIEEATQLMLQAARAGEGNFICDDNLPNKFDFADFEENASEFPIPSSTITEATWNQLDNNTPLYQPGGAIALWMKSDFLSLCKQNSDVAFKLLQRCNADQSGPCPYQILSAAGGLAKFEFDGMSMVEQFVHYAKRASLIMINDSYPTFRIMHFDTLENSSDPILEVHYANHISNQCMAYFNGPQVATGRFEDGIFKCIDRNNEEMSVKFFTSTNIVPLG